MLLLAATAATTAGLLVRGLVLRLRGKRRLAMTRLRSAVALAGAYMFALLTVSMTTEQRDLNINMAQCFGDWCGTLTRADRIGNQATARITIQNQGHTPRLRPDHPQLRLSDVTGQILPSASESGPPLNQPLEPGESFVKEYVFDVPGWANAPLLVWVTEGGWITRWLIGGRNSFLHRKTVTPVQQ